MKLKLLAVFVILPIISCSSSPQYTIQKLPSGKEIKVLSMGEMFFTKDKPASVLKYQTDVNIDNVDLLRKEVEEIWPLFRINVEKSKYSDAIIMATSPPIKKALIFSTTNSYNFVVSKRENGTWDLNLWKRDYNNEMKMLAIEYLKTSVNGDVINTVQSFHYPDDFTIEQKNKEIAGISKVLTIISDRLGSISKYNLNNSQIIYRFFALQSVSQEFWNKYPYLISLIYDVKYSKIGNGYLIFRFSMINDKLEINSILYGLPADNPQAEIVFKEINDDIIKEFSNT